MTDAFPIGSAVDAIVNGMAGAGVGAIVVAYLVRKTLKAKLSAGLTWFRLKTNDHLDEGVRAKFNDGEVVGVVKTVDSHGVHVRLDDGNLKHLQPSAVLDDDWTTVAECDCGETGRADHYGPCKATDGGET